MSAVLPSKTTAVEESTLSSVVMPAVGSSIAPTPTEAATASETSTIVATETPTSSTEELTTTAKPGREPSDKVYRFNGAIWKTKRQDSYNTKAEGGGGGGGGEYFFAGQLRNSSAVEATRVGTLRSEDGDGRQNVAEKVNSRSFNLHRNYPKSLTLSNVGEPSKS